MVSTVLTLRVCEDDSTSVVPSIETTVTVPTMPVPVTTWSAAMLAFTAVSVKLVPVSPPPVAIVETVGTGRRSRHPS